jgi:hypothetical protein
MRRVHIGLTIFWALAAIPTLLWWRDSILWVAFMSLWANVASHWAAYQASRVEDQVSDSDSPPGT